ncbi:MAG TPA: hypothetical protein VMM12_07965 [Longimicrobiales bacterium]|nr:hypothetical protein [Longimicrobiales bacterium]
MDIDGDALAGMIFTLVLVVIIGGIILMYPLTRRLGQLMEQRLAERTGGAAGSEVGELRSAVRSLEAEVERLGERQRFLEGLVESGDRRKELAGP